MIRLKQSVAALYTDKVKPSLARIGWKGKLSTIYNDLDTESSHLSLDKLEVPSALAQQFFVAARLFHPAILDHMYDIAIPDCTKSMSYGDRCSVHIIIQVSVYGRDLAGITVLYSHSPVLSAQPSPIQHPERSWPLCGRIQSAGRVFNLQDSPSNSKILGFRIKARAMHKRCR